MTNRDPSTLVTLFEEGCIQVVYLSIVNKTKLVSFYTLIWFWFYVEIKREKRAKEKIYKLLHRKDGGFEEGYRVVALCYFYLLAN